MGSVGNGWPRGGGEIGELLRHPAFDAIGLGPVESWPASLKHIAEMVLNSRQPKFVAWGPDLAFLYNDAYVPVFPERHPAALGKPFREVWADIWEQFSPIVARTLSGSPQLFKELLIPMRRDGRTEDTWFTFSYTPLRDDDGTIAGILCATLDVTDQVAAKRGEKLALDELRAKSEALAVVNRAGAAITVEPDVERLTQIVVDAGVTLTGAEFGAFFYNVDDGEGGSYMLYALSGVDRKNFEKFPMPRNTKVFAPTFDGEGIVRSDDILLDPRYGQNAPHSGMPKGHLPVRSYLAVPVKSRDGSVIGGLFFGHAEPGRFSQATEASLVSLAGQSAVAIDNIRLFRAAKLEIDQRRDMEDQLRKLNEMLEVRVAAEIADRQQAEAALQQAQKMESIGKLTGGVAHDFNNLLQVISGNLQLLGKDVAENGRAKERIANALVAVERGSRLASQLLAFGRRQPLEPKVVNIGRLVTGMDDMLRRALGEEIEVETIVSGGLWNTFADPVQIENALLNLAINSRDAMDGAGRLTIEVGNAFLDDSYSRTHPEVKAGQYVVLAVTDTGSGMTEEVKEQAFEPFFSTKPEGKGTGLGLSMVYGFVKQSGGHVKIYSQTGEGTTIKLYLPRSLRSEDRATAADTVPATGGTETILVAEDDEGVRATVIEMLSDLGYYVLKAKDAQSALTVIESGAHIDLLFTDVVMPGTLKSPELARLARARLPDIAVLYTSGYTEDSIVHGGRLDPGLELLSKPYTREDLARKIRHVLASRPQGGRGAADAARPNAKPSEPHHPETAAKPKLLLVEDDAFIRMDTAEILHDLGYDVIEAESGEQGADILDHTLVDIIVVDLGLPGMSGSAFAARAREALPSVGLVFATGGSDLPDSNHLSGSVLLPKPFNSAALDRAVKAALQPRL
ncbi:sensor histidine kinase/response regulator hybrid protein (plasmid) [Rhizobium phaseoli]|uniref:histidine kinase n=1 Tax=Rhizobium phaseoli TaxID=396 RepID=A0A192TKW0_9HYPH|nr:MULTISPECIES: response regulator [Rhizobium]MDH6648438.1 signal transduction histidine kinase/DNA-binding response OmpR family regulator [Rhizobium esperanzae]ANL30810.1 sensor histidine kinase/response regulator hybrid protein [Rhizobium phaseoli]ANL43234.1 sensor histidine kinase/response regulator hybrid protein [Rhizobium phaseoli]ANL56233.1 sensor histidine kinase/response regulator hybrid protein [Rhizobium phaseoli]ANL62220.1 sensor histidine kinase/response regulator hybrid protein 